MKKGKTCFTVCLNLFVILVLLCSCTLERRDEEIIEAKKIDLDIEVTSLSEKILSPDGNLASTKIVKYKLRGIGPDGEIFNWRTTQDGKFKIVGVSQGDWKLYADGYSENDTKIATGTTAVTFTENNTKATITLNKLYGSGTAKINVTWDTTMVSDKAFVELRIKKTGGTYVNKVFKTLNKGNALYEEVLPAGSYVVNALLYEDNTKNRLIAGTADAMRIVDNKITNGTLSLTIGNISTDYNLNIDDQTMAPIEGTLSVQTREPDIDSKSIVNANFKLSANTQTILTNLGVSENDINIEWFIDGILAADENTSDNKFNGTFTTNAGNRKISALLTSDKFGSTGNCDITVYLSPSARITLKPGEVLAPSDSVPFPTTGKFIVGYTPVETDKNNYKKSISFPYTNSKSTPVTLYPIYLEQNVLVDTVENSVKIKADYKDIKILVFPKGGSVTALSDNAFEGCTLLTSVLIPKDITKIGNSAFKDCVAIKLMTIPKSLITINDSAFANWTNSQIINIEATTKPAGWSAGWNKNCSAKIVWDYLEK